MHTVEAPPGASVWETEVFEHLARHVAAESELIGEYRRLARECEAEYVGYLTEVIVEDEQRHHRFLTDIAEALRADVELRAGGPGVPRLRRAPADDELLTAVAALREHERQDRRELRRLRRELEPVAQTTLWALLVDVMLLDTDKHARILDFLHSRLAELRVKAPDRT